MIDGWRAGSPRKGATAALLLLAVGAASAAPAGAAPRRAAARRAAARLTVVAIRASDATLDARQRFAVRATIANRGGRASPAQLQLTLSAPGNPTTTWSLGGARIASLRAGASRAVTLRATAPTLREAFPKGLVLKLCVRTRRGAAAVCRTDARRVRVALPARPTPVPPAPVPPAPTPPTPPAPPVFTSGARTTGDSLFPDIGNGGYDATHYDLDLSYTNVFTQELTGVATIDATATQNLSDFSLDFQTFAVSRVTVDGKLAAFEFDYVGRKLIVTPPAGILSGRSFTVAIAYHGVPAPVIDPDGSSEGWVADSTVGATALGEPMGSMGWFPSNNVPTDKATYDIAVTTAPDFQAVSNGVLARTTENGNDPDDPADDTTTYEWESDKPMASYLATVSIGRFDTSGTDLSDPDLPLYIYVDTGFTRAADRIIPNQQRVPEILDYFSGYYGVPYAFEAAGGIVPRVDVGYALETQSKPTYAGSTDPLYTGPGISTIAHENAHQWFGDLVTLSEWRDIWLNEGITEFSSWLWQANVNGGTAMDARLTSSLTSTSRSYWVIPPANPPEAGDIFNSNAMYRRGATTMTAIRQIFIDTPTLGEDAFRAMMRKWLTDHSFGNVTTEQFIALVKETDSARAARWDEFFREWLYTSYPGGTPATPGVTQPSIWPSNF